MDIASAGLINSALTTGTTLSSLLSLAPLVWLGKRSYGIYLWHVPIIDFIYLHRTEESLPPTAVMIITLALSVALAALTYRLVETRFRARTVLPRPASQMAG